MAQDTPPTPSEPASKTKPTSGPPPAWSRLHLWQMQPVRDVLLGLGIFGIFWLGQATSVVTVPLLLAILLAYLFEPVIQFGMQKLNLTRSRAVIWIIASIGFVVIVPAGLGIAYGTAQAVSFTTGQLGSLALANQARDEADEPAQRLYEARQARLLSQESTSLPGAPNQGQPESASTENEDAGTANASETEPIAQSEEPRDTAEAEGQATGDPGVSELSEEEIADLAQLRTIRERLVSETSGFWGWYYDNLLAEYTEHNEDAPTSEALTALNEFMTSHTETIAKTGAGVAVGTIERVLGFAVTLMSLAFMGFVTIFFFFFLATGWVEFKGFTDKLIPDKHRDRIVDLAGKFDTVISGFIRGRITIAFLQSIVFSVGYLIIGVPAAFILGPIVAILSIVPYLALVGVPVAIGLMFIEGPEGLRGEVWWMIAAPTVFYFMGQALDDYVWTPMIQGKSTGLDTPVILFASIAGGALFGVFGLLIAIPLAACAKILIQEIFWPRFKEWAEGRADDPLPIDDA